MSSFTINNLWANTVTFDLDQFKSNLFISLIFTNDYKLCTGIGYDIEKILFRVLFTMNFWNCKKTLVDDLTDYSSTWTGYNAKYFEDCSSSSSAEIIIFEKEYAEAVEDAIFYGTVDATSIKYCRSLFGVSSSALDADNKVIENDTATLFKEMAYNMLFNWVTVQYPGSLE